ncbi:hypothetical protein VTO42DRAFT_7975 [Malbranchea cinnamomea]
MSATQDLHNSLLHPPIIQILRAAGFHSARPAVVDTLTDIAARYLSLLATSTLEHARNSHEDMPTPRFDDVLMALQDAGALRPQLSRMEENWRGEEDMRGLDAFIAWAQGPVNREIRRVAGLLPSEGDTVDEESLEKEDFLSVLKKKHSKTGEESRFQGTVLGKDAEPRRIIIEGGVESIQEWAEQLVRSRKSSQTDGGQTTSNVNSAPNIPVPEVMET